MILSLGDLVRAGRFGVQIISLLLLMTAADAQKEPPIAYRLKYSAARDRRVQITLTLPEPISENVSFVMPRNYPGGYNLVPYDSFVENLRASSETGKLLKVEKEAEGPRWRLEAGPESLRRIDYDIDVERMERELPASIDTSKVRSGYLGILGYSVFGYIDGLQHLRIKLDVEGPEQWPVITTLLPVFPAQTARASAEANDYEGLADSQILMGPSLHLTMIKGKISLLLAAYSEGEADLSAEGELARRALDQVAAYFGNVPFPAYTVQLELLRPLPGHTLGFSQEHINSGTFTLPIAQAITKRTTTEHKQAILFNYAHHIAHCWIPKRAYGTGYFPFTWEMPPVIDTIWFNEGFARYAAIEALAEAMPQAEGNVFREGELGRLRQIIDRAPAFIRRMPLLELSREASFMYALDFRIGQNTYARGALMAAEIDTHIRLRTEGKKALREALRSLLDWTQANQRAFSSEELQGLLSKSSGVDLAYIVARWMKGNPEALSGGATQGRRTDPGEVR